MNLTRQNHQPPVEHITKRFPGSHACTTFPSPSGRAKCWPWWEITRGKDHADNNQMGLYRPDGGAS